MTFFFFPLLLGLAVVGPGDDYKASIETWRRGRETRLRADEGWLTLAGLCWLKEGVNTFGAGPGNDIALPEGSAAPRAGVFEFHAGATLVKANPGTQFTVNGVAAQEARLKSDEAGDSDVVRFGRIAMMVIKRGKRYAIRVKDKESKYRTGFQGLDWYPVQQSYRVTAKWAPYGSPRVMNVPTILGEDEQYPSPGYAVFHLGGKEYKMVPVLEEPDAKQLFFILKDQTSGKETYPAGRFLYADMPKNGQVILDFNKAYSPPCAFTPYATCPLPPKENRLGIRLEAGEKFHGHY